MTVGWNYPTCNRGVAPTVSYCDDGGDGTVPVARYAAWWTTYSTSTSPVVSFVVTA